MSTAPYRPSNGDEGYSFIDRFCCNCTRDRQQNCSILARSMAYEVKDKDYPKEWVQDIGGGNARCTSFRDKRANLPPTAKTVRTRAAVKRRKAIKDFFDQ